MKAKHGRAYPSGCLPTNIVPKISSTSCVCVCLHPHLVGSRYAAPCRIAVVVATSNTFSWTKHSAPVTAVSSHTSLLVCASEWNARRCSRLWSTHTLVSAWEWMHESAKLNGVCSIPVKSSGTLTHGCLACCCLLFSLVSMPPRQ